MNLTVDPHWQRAHSADGSDPLAPVCHPYKPAWFNNFFDRIQRRAVGRALAATSLKMASVRALDIGCGRGRWIEYLARRGATAIGIDPVASAVQSVRHQGLNAEEASATELPFGDNSFDLLTSITVLMHLTSDEKELALREVARVLKPGSWLVMLESTFPEDPTEWVYGLSLWDWRMQLEEVGLRIHYTEGHCYTPGLRFLPARIPARDHVAVWIDERVERAAGHALNGRPSKHALQHVIAARLEA